MAWTKGQGVIESGEGKVLVYSKELEAYESTGTYEFTADDLVGELADISGFGASRETKEINGFHYDSAVKKVLGSVPNDLSVTENLTKAGITLRRQQYNDRKLIMNVIYSVDDKSILYACTGKISQWGMELPLGDVASLTYTLALEVDDVPETQLTMPE